MKAYLCLYIWSLYQNDVFAYSTSLGTFGPDSTRPPVISMNGGNNEGSEEIGVQATKGDEIESNFIKPTWEKRTEWLHDSNKPLISYNLGIHKGTEIKGTTHGLSERSENDNDIVSNIGDPRQPGSIFFKPYWTSQGKNTLYHENNGFINHPANNGFNNHAGQNGIYQGSKGVQQSNIVQTGKGFKSRLWKPQYASNKGFNNHPDHTSLSGSKGNKQSHNFQVVKSFYSLSRDNSNFTNPNGKKKVPYKLRDFPYHSIYSFQSSTQNPSRSVISSVNVRNKKWDKNSSQNKKSAPVLQKNILIKGTDHKLDHINSYRHDKPNPLRNRIIYSKREGPMKKQQENQEITNWLPSVLRDALNYSSFEKSNDIDKPSAAKIHDHHYRHKRSTSMNDPPSSENDQEATTTGQFLIWNPNSPNVENLPVRHTLNLTDLGDIILKPDHRLENTLISGTIKDKRVRTPKGHSWNQRDVKYSENFLHPARHGLNPIVLAAKGLNALYPEKINTDHLGGRNTNHPDETSNGNNQNLDVERNIHYPDITGMKNVHPKDLLHYLRILKDLVEPTSSILTTAVKGSLNTRKDDVTTPVPVLSWKEASKWGGILFRAELPKNGSRSRFLAFPLGRSNVLRDDDDGPVKYKFHFGGILWWG